MELALANDNVAAMVFWRFLDFAMEAGYELFGNIIYIPGNHDHHLWESARETQYVLNYLPGKDTLDEPPGIPPISSCWTIPTQCLLFS